MYGQGLPLPCRLDLMGSLSLREKGRGRRKRPPPSATPLPPLRGVGTFPRKDGEPPGEADEHDTTGRNMRIALITLGSEGDVRPFLALGLGLQAAGHDVLLVTHAAFESLIHSWGVACSPVGNDPRDVLENEMGQTWLDTGNNALHFFRQFSRIADSLIQQYMLDCWNACQGAEAIVFSTIGLAVGYPIAEKLGVPFSMAAPYPLTPTRAFRSLSFSAVPPSLPFKGFYNHLTHVLSMQIFWQLVRPAVNKARREVLNLPSLSPNWPLSEMRRGRITLLYCYSPSIVPPASDWSSWN